MLLYEVPKAITQPLAEILYRYDLDDPDWIGWMNAFVLTDDERGIIPIMIGDGDFAIVPYCQRGEVNQADIESLKEFMAEKGYSYAEY